MFKFRDEDHPFKLNSNSKVYDIFFETKKIVYNTKTYNDYIKRSPSLNSLSDLNRKTLSPMLTRDNFIPINRSSLKLPKELVYSHNSIKNREENRYNGFSLKSCLNDQQTSSLEKDEISLNTLSLKQNTVSRNMGLLNTKMPFYATSIKNNLKYSLNKQSTAHATNDFYWDSKLETYFTLKETRVESDRGILVNSLEALKKDRSQNLITSLTKNHFQGTNNQVTYYLKSFQLQLKSFNNTMKIGMKNVELMIPFSYIPIIYCLDSDSLIWFIILTTKFNDKFTQINFIEDKVYQFINTYESLHNISKNCQSLYNHFQSQKFDWITPNLLFEAIIKMPCVEITYEANNIRINKVLEMEVMIDIFKNAFVNWDDKVINFVNRIKMFRQIINKSFSKFSLKGRSNQSERQTEKFIDFDIIKENYYNERNLIFNFGITCQNNVNKIATFKTYQIVARHYTKNLTIDMNFKQFKILEKISETLDLETFIKKLILIDTKEPYITLNIQYFDYIDDNFFKFLKKNLNHEENKKANSDVFITVNKPVFELRDFESSHIQMKDKIAPEKIVKELVKKDLNKWKYVFAQFSSEFEDTIFDDDKNLNNESKKQSCRRNADSLIKEFITKKKNNNNTDDLEKYIGA